MRVEIIDVFFQNELLHCEHPILPVNYTINGIIFLKTVQKEILFQLYIKASFGCAFYLYTRASESLFKGIKYYSMRWAL